MEDEELNCHELDYLFEDASKEPKETLIDWNARWSSNMVQILKYCDSHNLDARVQGIKLTHLFTDRMTENFVVNQGLDGLLFDVLHRKLHFPEVEVTEATMPALISLLKRYYKKDQDENIVSKHDTVLIRIMDQIDLLRDVQQRVAYLRSLPPLFDLMNFHLIKHTKRLNDSLFWILEEELFPGNIDIICSALDAFYRFLTIVWPRSSNRHLDLYLAKLIILKLKLSSNDQISDEQKKSINDRILNCLGYIRENDPQSFQERMEMLKEVKNLANMLPDCDKEELGFTSISTNSPTPSPQ